jgi:hypothetical protein
MQTAGSTAWVLANGTYRQHTLNDAEHVGSGGVMESWVSTLTPGGIAAGGATRFGGGGGRSAWVSDGDQTRRIGLLGPFYTRSDGWQYSNLKPNPDWTKANGTIAGTSKWFLDDLSYGDTAWVYKDGQCKVIEPVTSDQGTGVLADTYSLSLSNWGDVRGRTSVFRLDDPDYYAEIDWYYWASVDVTIRFDRFWFGGESFLIYELVALDSDTLTGIYVSPDYSRSGSFFWNAGSEPVDPRNLVAGGTASPISLSALWPGETISGYSEGRSVVLVPIPEPEGILVGAALGVLLAKRRR